jgi:hypothetical protein
MEHSKRKSKEIADGVFEKMKRRKLPKTESWWQRLLSRIFKSVDINKEGGLYLRRWLLLRHPWGHIYLHRICLPDLDRHPHDHPWNSFLIILKGGYIEKEWPVPKDLRWTYDRTWGMMSMRRMKAEYTHQITDHLGEETWSLVFCGRYVRMWGFWTEDGWVNFRDYLKRPEVAEVTSTDPPGDKPKLNLKWNPLDVDDHICMPVRGPKRD